MDEKVLEELQFHQEVISQDGTSPLHLIREKEMEISGRVLAAKREAEEIVALARRKTVEMTAKADDEGAKAAAKHAADLVTAAEADIERVKQETSDEVQRLRQTIAKREADAVAFLVNEVKQV